MFCQTRDSNVDQSFSHENHPAPPSLFLRGEIRLGTIADLLRFMMTENTASQPLYVVSAVFLDGTAVVFMLNPDTAKTFREYADDAFVPYAKFQPERTSRHDIIWGIYKPSSLIGEVRQKREKGIRRRVVPTTVMPKY